jgi:putative colanic acid biosynthesis acetyltransferase WcaF
MRIRLDRFDPRAGSGLDRGRPFLVEAAWYVAQRLFFATAVPWPSASKAAVLRFFGARVGRGVVVKPRVRILFPWKLVVGDHVWIGEEAWILNFEPVSLGDHACLSQRAFLCAGNHDFRDPAMAYRNAPIVIGPGAWIGAQSFVAPGVTVGAEAVVTAGSVVAASLPPAQVCGGNPCRPLRARWKEGE